MINSIQASQSMVINEQQGSFIAQARNFNNFRDTMSSSGAQKGCCQRLKVWFQNLWNSLLCCCKKRSVINGQEVSRELTPEEIFNEANRGFEVAEANRAFEAARAAFQNACRDERESMEASHRAESVHESQCHRSARCSARRRAVTPLITPLQAQFRLHLGLDGNPVIFGPERVEIYEREQEAFRAWDEFRNPHFLAIQAKFAAKLQWTLVSRGVSLNQNTQEEVENAERNYLNAVQVCQQAEQESLNLLNAHGETLEALIEAAYQPPQLIIRPGNANLREPDLGMQVSVEALEASRRRTRELSDVKDRATHRADDAERVLRAAKEQLRVAQINLGNQHR